MITIKAKPFEVKAELPGYGVFRLKHLGASLGAELKQKLNEAQAMIDDAKNAYKDIVEKETELTKANDEKALDSLKASPRYQQAVLAQKEASKKLEEALEFSDKCLLGLWSSDDPKALEKLLTDFTPKEIKSFYEQVMAEADNA